MYNVIRITITHRSKIMKNLYELVEKAKGYTRAYCKQYNITDEILADAIYVTHLAYLLNNND